jgi:hypothetical protein
MKNQMYLTGLRFAAKEKLVKIERKIMNSGSKELLKKYRPEDFPFLQENSIPESYNE